MNYIYILKQKKQGWCKVGKTTTPTERISTLEKTWGKFDSDSIIYQMNDTLEQSLDNIETTIHRSLTRKYLKISMIGKDIGNDGYIEFFRLDTLVEEVIDYLYGDWIIKTYNKKNIQKENLDTTFCSQKESVKEKQKNQNMIFNSLSKPKYKSIEEYEELIKITSYSKSKREEIFDTSTNFLTPNKKGFTHSFYLKDYLIKLEGEELNILDDEVFLYFVMLFKSSKSLQHKDIKILDIIRFLNNEKKSTYKYHSIFKSIEKLSTCKIIVIQNNNLIYSGYLLNNTTSRRENQSIFYSCEVNEIFYNLYYKKNKIVTQELYKEFFTLKYKETKQLYKYFKNNNIMEEKEVVSFFKSIKINISLSSINENPRRNLLIKLLQKIKKDFKTINIDFNYHEVKNEKSSLFYFDIH